METKPTHISIGIPVFNESANIERLIRSIQMQKEQGFVLREIIVVSDGSTDRTHQIVQGIADPRIRFIAQPERLGKPARMNDIVAACTGDILVMFDGDVVLADATVLTELTRPFASDPEMVLVAGRPVPTVPLTVFRKIMQASFFLQDYIKTHLHQGQNVYAVHGRVVALRAVFARTLRVPAAITGTDAFLYFSTVSAQKNMHFAPRARVLYQNPGTYADFLKQARRFKNTQSVLTEHFAFRLDMYFAIPLRVKVQALVMLFVRLHVYAALYLVIKVYTHLHTARVEATWQPVESTKQL